MSLALLALPQLARAQDSGGGGGGASKKAEEKKNSRWTLAEWLAQKQKNQWMDMWLAKNSQTSPFEFYLDGGSINYNKRPGDANSEHFNYNDHVGAMGLYAGFAGLRGYYDSMLEENRNQWGGSFNLRLLGRAMQDTHLNIEYGLRGLTLLRDGSPLEKFQNQFGGVELTIYFSKYFGIEGNYRKILPESSSLNTTMEGEGSQAKVFIDFLSLRVYGVWMLERLKFENQGLITDEVRDGYGAGLRLFF